MSMFSDPAELIERTLMKIKRMEDFHAFVVTNFELIEEQEGEYDIVNNEFNERIRFELREGEFEEQLTAARIFMRKLLGTWKDEFKSTWNPYGKVVIVSWQDKNHDKQLWMECTLDNFPKSLYPSEKCSWMEDKDLNPTKALVCEVL